MNCEPLEFTLLHGTTAANAKSIRANGFAKSDPARVARLVEDLLGLPRDSIYNDQYFRFARERIDLDHVHFTTRPDTAKHYSLPEQVQDALDVAYHLIEPPHEDESAHSYRPGKEVWMALVAPLIVGPGVILEVKVPYSLIGRHAFGRELTRDEFDTLLDGKVPETLSIPVNALTVAEIHEAVHPGLF